MRNVLKRMYKQLYDFSLAPCDHPQDSNAATEELFSTSDDGPLGSGGSNKLMHATKMLPDMTEGQVSMSDLGFFSEFMFVIFFDIYNIIFRN